MSAYNNVSNFLYFHIVCLATSMGMASGGGPCIQNGDKRLEYEQFKEDRT